MFTWGRVIQANNRTITIRLNTGKLEVFFYNLKGFNKSLRVNDECKVWYKNTIFGQIATRATKCHDKVD